MSLIITMGAWILFLAGIVAYGAIVAAFMQHLINGGT